jgi:hypothetical protein
VVYSKKIEFRLFLFIFIGGFNMRVTNVKTKGNWRDVADSCNTTINKDEGTNEPSSKWKRRMLLCEHSPIRQIVIKWKWLQIKRWVSDHFVRHKFGIEHWVKTDRTDRTGVDRDQLSQSSLTNHECEANAQAIINISRKRLCKMASPETRQAWIGFLNELKEVQPELYSSCVPDCIYRGHCFEYKSCGDHKKPEFKERLKQYRGDINA